VGPDDLLVLLPAPRVVAVAHSQQTYGAGESVTSVSATTPSDVRPGDMLVALVASRKDVASTGPAGFALAATADAPGTVAGAESWLLRMRAYTRTATGAEGSSVVSATQAATGRMSLVILVVRGGAATVELVDVATAAYATANLGPGLHPIPTVTADRRGMLAVHAGQCAIAQAGSTTVSAPAGWEHITSTTGNAQATVRMWVAHRRLALGEPANGGMLHETASGGAHDGGSLTLLLGAT